MSCTCTYCAHNATTTCGCPPCAYIRRNGWECPHNDQSTQPDQESPIDSSEAAT